MLTARRASWVSMVLMLSARCLLAVPVWQSAGSLISARYSHTATLMQDGRVLVVGGRDTLGDVSSVEIFDTATGVWKSSALPFAVGPDAASVLLLSGEVLVAGGESNTTGRAALFDPRIDQWTEVAQLPTRRYQHSMTLLRDGRVLLVGGLESPSTLSASALLFDPSAGNWQSANSPVTSRTRHTATLLQNGRVLVAGGETVAGATLASVEIFDPVSGNWSAGDSLSAGRSRHTATGLPDGRVLVAGGWNGSATLATTAVFDPSVAAGSGQWSAGPTLSIARRHHVAVLAPAGTVVVAGGETSPDYATSSGEVLPLGAAIWSPTDPLPSQSERGAAILLPSGEVLLIGGRIPHSGGGSSFLTSSACAILDLTTGSWSYVASLTYGRNASATTLLADGRVMVATGWSGGGPTTSVEIYSPETNVWSAAAALPVSRTYPSAILLADGRVLVLGGGNFNVGVLPTHVWDANSNAWTFAGNLHDARSWPTVDLLADGRILAAGGTEGCVAVRASAEIWDPATSSWSLVAPMHEARYSHASVVLPDGRVLVAGGYRTACGYLLEVSKSVEIYDPRSDEWTVVGELQYARGGHVAWLLRSGEVLIAGGMTAGSVEPPGSEIFDPATGTSRLVSFSGAPRTGPIDSAVGDRVIFVGGQDLDEFLMQADQFDGSSRIWTQLPPPAEPRTLYQGFFGRLLDNRLLAAGGWNERKTAEALDLYSDVPSGRSPSIDLAPAEIAYGTPWTITGSFSSDSGSSGGAGTSSSSDLPLVMMEQLEGTTAAYLIPDPIAGPLGDPMDLTISSMPPIFGPGFQRVTVIVNGIPSASKIVHLQCSLAITSQPQDVEVYPGETATFTVAAAGGRFYQWQRCITGACGESDWIDIPGATGPTYTTGPTTAGDAGARYRAVVGSGCMDLPSDGAVLNLGDSEPPTAAVESPAGGEYWILSDPGSEPRSELISWSMSDNVRICQVRVSLWASDDGGATYVEVPPSGGLPATFGPGGVCPFPGVATTNFAFVVPESPPSGSAGSLYKVQIEVTDHLGNTLVVDPDSGLHAVRSARPFYIVEPNPDSVRTLILSNIPRMMVVDGINASQAESLAVKLTELANHPRVLGVVIDLSNVTDVEALYQMWDDDLLNPDPDPAIANLVLVGCHAPLVPPCTQELDGVHDLVRKLATEVYTGVESIVVVGGDEIVPFARLVDRATLLPEYTYLAEGNLTLGSTVGMALADNLFLSDDPLATLDPIALGDLATDLFVPDLASGRLIETPEEITGTIASFISRDGVIDLPATAATADDHRVLVSGYDFLTDAAARIRQRFKTALGAPGDPAVSLSPIDGTLVGGDWGIAVREDREAALHAHLDGDGDGEGGGRPYAIMSLNGHASHFEEGVPGSLDTEIAGLPAIEIAGSDGCGHVGTLGALDLSGSFAYSIGCHGGLPVPGSCSTDPDRSLDLSETMLRSGALAYVGNTGYGWGLKLGIGYSERLAEILTEEITRGGTVTVGDALTEAKQRFVMESPRFDGYAEKTIEQWTLFGLPMVAIKSGIAVGGGASSRKESGRSPGELVRSVESFGPVSVRRGTETSSPALSAVLPPSLTRLDLHFDFSAAGVYRKYTAAGSEITGTSGCPDALGCYYTLNGLAELSTGATDLPVQPYFVYDSRLSGASQHGVLWSGGTYLEEGGWKSLIAELASNGGDGSNHGAAPRTKMIKNIGTRWVPGDDPSNCRTSDLELNSAVVVAGESLKSDPLLSGDDVERTYRGVDLEIFYFNDTSNPAANCDREGPVLGTGPYSGNYHVADGPVVSWSVPATDAQGAVWRVLVVYTDNQVDAQGMGSWVPLELQDGDGDEVWTGQASVAAGAMLTYVIEAVDNRGNVTWLDYLASAPGSLRDGVAGSPPNLPGSCVGDASPASGVEPGIACPVDVSISVGAADLALSILDSPDPVGVEYPLNYTLLVSNLGPSVAHAVQVEVSLPPSYVYLGALGDGWSCAKSNLVVTCSLLSLDVGTAPPLTLVGAAPTTATGLLLEGTATAVENDPIAGNESESETTQVVVPLSADLAITKDVDLLQALSGSSITYSIAVANTGPDDVSEALVTDQMPAGLSNIFWLCVATAGSSCTAAGQGNIQDSVTLQSGGTATYTVHGIVEQTVGGSLVNSATILAPVQVSDPAGNNLDEAATLIAPSLFGDGFETGYVNRWGPGSPCLHSECVEGAPLAPVCNACADQVCASDSSCCDSSWDNSCVALAVSVCGLSCP